MRQFLIVLLSVMLLASVVADFVWAQTPGGSSDSDRILLHSFASGQRSYIQTDSFTPVGNGKLQYRVVGDLAAGGQRISLNEIDCSTGQSASPVKSWEVDN